jgi:hypothetical protein
MGHPRGWPREELGEKGVTGFASNRCHWLELVERCNDVLVAQKTGDGFGRGMQRLNWGKIRCQ